MLLHRTNGSFNVNGRIRQDEKDFASYNEGNVAKVRGWQPSRGGTPGHLSAIKANLVCAQKRKRVVRCTALTYEIENPSSETMYMTDYR